MYVTQKYNYSFIHSVVKVLVSAVEPFATTGVTSDFHHWRDVTERYSLNY